MITREIFQNYLDCKYKAFLKRSFGAVSSEPNQYALAVEALDAQYRTEALQQMYPNMRQNAGGEPADAMPLMATGADVVLLASVSNHHFNATIDALEKVKGKSNLGSFYYEPTLCTRRPSPPVTVKLILGFLGMALADVQGRAPQFGKIISGEGRKSQKVRLAKFISQARKLIDAIASEKSEAKLILNSHCRSCEYQTACTKRARETDNLSLISSLSEKEILKLNARGIFTVTQLSYTFRPRRKRKGPLTLKDNPALRALAIREGKTYIVDPPKAVQGGVALYVDVEGIPDQDVVYLIGVLVDNGENKSYQFWADGHSNQQTIWNQFVSLISQYDSPTIFHHGKYDAVFFKKMQALYGGLEANFFKTNVINTVGLLYGRIFFPTYSNGLKDVANFLGFKWASENASGIQSILWRRNWEISSKEEFKNRILQYNRDDCEALRLLVKSLNSLGEPNKSASVVNCSDLKIKKSQFRWGRNEFAFPELELVNSCAYFDYQQSKIYWRTDKDVKKRRARKERERARQPRVNKAIISKRPRRCPSCGNKYVEKHAKAIRTIYDLKFSESGVKRWVMQYRNYQFLCRKCMKVCYSDEHPSTKEKYGHNLLAWVIYQYIGLRQSQERVANGIRDIFRIPMGKQGGIAEFKKKAAALYQNAYTEILLKLRTGNLVHVDETKVSIKGATGYVWVFTNMEEVAYVYSASREGAILTEILPGFNGVVVSDYYPAYDGLECKQQRCLIHLIRDLNDDLFKNQFDGEFKTFVQKFGELLKPIIQTIDKFGLKKHNLAHHKKAVANFFKHSVVSDGKSELTQKYQKRFIRNQDRLFTFLDYDGVPWNNNNAENAIKGFATLRRVIGGSSTEKGLGESLSLLSICQTLRNKGHNSLEFFRSRDLSIYDFLKRFE